MTVEATSEASQTAVPAAPEHPATGVASRPAIPEPPAASPPRAVFTGNEKAYWRLMVRGAALQTVTLGLYRFWLMTDVRRFLWCNTAIDDDSFEYRGTALELLAGFLLAILLLLPFYAAYFLVTLSLGIMDAGATIIGFCLLAALGQAASYRARRYRLTRTIFRGLRLHQDGAAWAYAVRAILWWTAILLTLGLAYPFAQTSLERYKLRHTFYGDLQGTFEGSGASLFARGVGLWLLVMVPAFAGIAVSAKSIDWAALVVFAPKTPAEIAPWLKLASPDYGNAVVYLMLAIGWSVLAACMLYPLFQKITLRWWLNGLRFGALTATSDLKAGPVYRAYFRFLMYGLAFTLIAGGFSALLAAVAGTALDKIDNATVSEVATAVLMLVGYVIAALAFSTIYQVTIKLALWRLGVTSVTLNGSAILDTVKASGQRSSSFGEGLADALNVGGI